VTIGCDRRLGKEVRLQPDMKSVRGVCQAEA